MTEFRTGLTLYIRIPYDIDLPICLFAASSARARGPPGKRSARDDSLIPVTVGWHACVINLTFSRWVTNVPRFLHMYTPFFELSSSQMLNKPPVILLSVPKNRATVKNKDKGIIYTKILRYFK